MDSYEIYRQANTLVRRYGTRDPEQIIKELGIVILCDDNFKNLLGMYTYRWKHRIIIYSSKIESYLKKMVLAHELGHDRRHRDIAKAGQPLKEFSLFRMTDITEYEANAFASHILLDNDEVYSLAREGYDCPSIAQMMGSDINLMLIKLQEMNKLGYNLRVSMDADPRFFRKIKGSNLSEYTPRRAE